MTAKHAPASPLPWTTNEKSYPPDHVFAGVTIVADCKWTPHVQIEERMQNAAYIAHAANQYPKLVEALRELAACESAYQEQPTDGTAWHLDRAITATRALLRSLGEE